MATYNGHKNWNHWNVSLWLNNDEGLYRTARDYAIFCRNGRGGLTAAAQGMLNFLRDEMSATHTPDGAPYSATTVRAAMVGM